MKYRPIDLKPNEVRGILSGRQTQIRRIAKLDVGGCIKEPGGHRRWHPADPNASHACKYGKPGDRLWGRETYIALGRWETRFNQKKGRDEWHFVDMTAETGRAYRYAEGETDPVAPAEKRRTEASAIPSSHKRPSAFMPRWASRITLEVTAVRVERLQDISEADARSEGVELGGPIGHLPTYLASPYSYHYAQLWDSIHGPDSWDDNPWVEVCEFKRIEGGAA